MKYTQNEKIKQITDQTLVVGTDIASILHEPGTKPVAEEAIPYCAKL
jgi:hypothetical protein